MIALRVVAGVTNHFMMRLPEWACSIILLIFGLTSLQTGNTFDNASFSVMARYGSEDVWGRVLVAVASIRLTALILNGTFPWFVRWSVRIRAASATLCCFAWFSIALGLVLANPASTGAKTYGALLVVDMILAVFIAGQAGRADRSLWHGRA